MTVTDWISALANVVVAVGVVFVWRQVLLLRSQINTADQQAEASAKAFDANQIRYRKEYAVSVLREWQSNISLERSAANRLVSLLDDEQSRNLATRLSVKIKQENQAAAEDCLGSPLKNPNVQADGLIGLDEAEVKIIRFHTMNHLNFLEIALTAWQLNIADNDTIQEQFSFLYRPDRGYDALAKFRTAQGRPTAYPAIEEFINVLAQRWKGTI